MAAPGLTTTFTGLTGGATYTATVTPVYAAGDTTVVTPASATPVTSLINR